MHKENCVFQKCKTHDDLLADVHRISQLQINIFISLLQLITEFPVLMVSYGQETMLLMPSINMCDISIPINETTFV